MPRSPSRDELSQFLDAHAPARAIADAGGVVAHEASDVYALWAAWEALVETKLSEVPFWAAVWPAARVLAAYFARSPQIVRGRRLELGCGGGVAAIAAAKAGAARVIANDIDPVAVRVAALNADLNGVELSTDHRDRSNGEFSDAEVIVVADMFYERAVSERLTGALKKSSAHVLIGDGGRKFVPREGLEELYAMELCVNEALEGVPVRKARVISLQR